MKKLKYIFIALAVIILAVGGYVLYEFKFKTYDVADEEIDKILEETFEVELPDGTKIVLDKEGNVVKTDTVVTSENTNTSNASTSVSGGSESSNGQQNEANSEQSTSSETVSNGNEATQNGAVANNTSPTEKMSVEEIKAKYAGTFGMLENQARGRLNGLISRAKAEYSQKKSNGESIQFGYFYNKYMGAATSMEANVDGAVKGVMSLIESELKANGYDKSHAQSFQQQYNATKKALRDEMMSQALSFK